jgi:hypothetical protein
MSFQGSYLSHVHFNALCFDLKGDIKKKKDGKKKDIFL